MKYLSMVTLLVLAAGCNREPGAGTTPASSSSQTAPVASQGGSGLEMLPAIPVSTDPGEVLAEVGTNRLTRAQAERDIDMRIAAAGPDIPPAQAQMMRTQFTGKIIEQFVIRSLLLDEASRSKIEITAEDEKQAFDRIEEYLKTQGRTLEETLENSPMGKERMLEEVKVGVTIDKLLAARLPKAAEPTEGEISAFMVENEERLSVPERVSARHILLSVEADAEAATRESKRVEADRLRAELTNGADFAELARTHSDCPSSARGGDLGEFGRGQMVKPFEEAAFSQKIDEVGEVVETQFGYHIIQVSKHDEPGQVPREDIVDFIKQRQRQQDMKQFVDTLLAQTSVKYADSVTGLIPESIRPSLSVPAIAPSN